MTKRLILLFVTLLLLVSGSLGLDKVAGLFITPHGQGLIFPRNVSVRFDTPEFSSTVKTNSLGFRDREFTAQKSKRMRIVAIGDSFTYGWGVQVEESWPKVMEDRLQSAGMSIEVANLGKPGGSVTNYADIAEQCFPVLHPDLLIVAVLQGDDLAQMGFPPTPVSRLGQDTEASDRALRRFAKRLYPNLLSLIDQSDGASKQFDREWQSLAQTTLATLTPPESRCWDQLDGNVKKAFLAGELNPSLVYLAIKAPDYFMETMNLNSPIASTHILQMADQLRRVESAADANQAKAIVVSVPYGIYVSRASFETRKRIGFNSVPEMLTGSEPDEAIRQAAQLAGLDFYEVTDHFRSSSDNQQLFFELDGHFNRAGHALFAEALTPIIRDRLVTQSK